MLVVLATFIGSVGLVRNHGLADVVVLARVLVLIACVAQRMIISSWLFSTSSGPATDVALPLRDDLRPE